MIGGLQHGGAFVVQFQSGTDFAAGLVEGRVEHIATGRSGSFESSAALLVLLARLLKEAQSLESEELAGEFHSRRKPSVQKEQL